MGNGRVAECISQLIFASETGGAAAADDDAEGSGEPSSGLGWAGCWLTGSMALVLLDLTGVSSSIPLLFQLAEKIPKECEADVYKFYINRSTNINMNVPLGELTGRSSDCCAPAGPSRLF
jgi:hypothetical protein